MKKPNVDKSAKLILERNTHPVILQVAVIVNPTTQSDQALDVSGNFTTLELTLNRAVTSFGSIVQLNFPDTDLPDFFTPAIPSSIHSGNIIQYIIPGNPFEATNGLNNVVVTVDNTLNNADASFYYESNIKKPTNSPLSLSEAKDPPAATVVLISVKPNSPVGSTDLVCTTTIRIITDQILNSTNFSGPVDIDGYIIPSSSPPTFQGMGAVYTINGVTPLSSFKDGTISLIPVSLDLGTPSTVPFVYDGDPMCTL